jgi:hypothetical protein
MRPVVILTLLFSCLASAVQAGAWARPRGEVFLSFSSNLHSSIESLADGVDAMSRHDSVYLEYGLGHRLTFSAEIGRGQHSREAMGLLRSTLTRPDARFQVALDFGAGQRSADGQDNSTLARLGLSLGYGYGITPPHWMPLDLQGGWIALDAHAVRDMSRQEDRWKVEATFGLTLSERSRFMLQVVAEEWAGLDVTYALNPSFVYQIRGGTSVELGVRAIQGEDVQLGLELGFWHQF